MSPALAAVEASQQVLALLHRVAWHGARPPSMAPIVVTIPVVVGHVLTQSTIDALARVALKEPAP